MSESDKNDKVEGVDEADIEQAAPAVWHVDPVALRPGRLVPPLSKADAQRALVLSYALGRQSWAALPGSRNEVPIDVRVLEQGLKTLARRSKQPLNIECGDGGAPYRILVGQAAVSPGALIHFFGTARLGERPHKPLYDSLRHALGPYGLVIQEGSPWPVEVRGADGTGEPRFRVAGSESSQFVTSLLLASAVLFLREGRTWTVELVGPTASMGYLDLTLQWLERMGFATERRARSVAINGWAEPSSPPSIPGDWSSLAYLLLVAWRTGGTVARVDLNALHPDREILRVLEQAGLTVEQRGDDELAVTGEVSSGVSASGAKCPDLLPTVAALACVLPTPSRLTDVTILRGKESDRLQGIIDLVQAAGGTATLEGSTLAIEPGTIPNLIEFNSRGDHRMAMSAATLCVLSGSELKLTDPECVGKSFPSFWSQMQGTGLEVSPI